MMDMSAADAKPRNMKKKAARTMADPEDRNEKEKRPMFEKAWKLIVAVVGLRTCYIWVLRKMM